MDKNTTFIERLTIGNDKEDYVNEILNLSGIPCELNNLENVKDIDLYLPHDNLYIDVKYIENVFKESLFYTNVKPEDCLIIDKKHLKTYEEKRKLTGIDTWVAFFINFKEFNIYELRFIRTEDIIKLIEEEKAIVRSIKEGKNRKMKINFDKNYCLNVMDFYSLIKNKRI